MKRKPQLAARRAPTLGSPPPARVEQGRCLDKLARYLCWLALAAVGCTRGTAGGGVDQEPGATPTAGSPSTMASAGAAASASGAPGAANGGAGPSTCLASADEPTLGLTARRARRLSRREYTNVVADLLGAKAREQALGALPDEPTVGGFDNQNAALFVSPSLQENLANLAEQLARSSDPAVLAPCATAAGSAACLQDFINSFSEKAYGRPLTPDELGRATSLAGEGQDYATQVRLIVEMVLQSPYTLYATELGPDGAAPSPQPVPLTAFELASQLSFLLTGTRPDAMLRQAAATGAFSTVAAFQEQAQRLLPTALGQAQLARFIRGWLDIGPISEVPKSPEMYPEFTSDVAAAMQQEFDAFVSQQLAGGNGTLASLFTATSDHVPDALRPIYGTDLLASGLDPKQRTGVLSLPAVLAYNSSDISSGPVQRGLLVRRQLLCQSVPPPPERVLQQLATMPVDTIDTTQTTRQKFQAHLTEASCSACHSLFDPIGFGFESMDGVGRFRTRENGLPVDSTGALTGTDVDGPFEGPAELSVKLAQSKMIASCMVSHFFNFAQARDAVAADQCVLQEWTTQFARGGGRIADLIGSYIAHRNFTYRKDDR